jgi:threonine synthase
MPPESLRCKECRTTYPLDARYVCERCFGPLEVAYASLKTSDPEQLRRRIQQGPHSLWRYVDFLPVQTPPAGVLPAGFTPLLKADRLAERLGLKHVWIKNDAANPTHSFKDRVVSIAMARARELGFSTIACASTGNLANAVAAHSAAAGLESYVFIPSNLEEQKILATGVYGTNVIGVRGNYDDVNRLCTELSGEHDWAFVNINMRPYYAEGSKTLAFETAEQLDWELPDRVVAPIASGSLFTKIARGFEEWTEVGLLTGRRPTFNGAQADGPYALDLARSSGGGIDAVSDEEIREGIRLLAQTTGIFTETAGGVTTAVLAKLARRGDIDPDERVVVYITGEGLKTLDAVRGSFTVREIDPTVDSFERSDERVAAFA